MENEPNLLLATLVVILLLWSGALTIFTYRLYFQVKDTQHGYVIIYRQQQELSGAKIEYEESKQDLESWVRVITLERELNNKQIRAFEDRLAKLELY